MTSNSNEIKNINEIPNTDEIKYIQKPEDFDNLDTEELHLTDDTGKVLSIIKGKGNIKGFLNDHFEFNNKITLKHKLKQKIQIMEDLRNNKL